MHIDPDDLNDPKPLSPDERRILIGFCLVVFGLFAADIIRDFSPAKTAVLFFLLAWAPLTIIHELGHAWVARLFGWRVYEVVIGFGRIIKSWRWHGARVEIRALPLGGHVVPVPARLEGARLANFFVYAAGPAAELALVGLFALFLGVDTLTTATDHLGLIAAQSVCAAALTGAIINLIPLSTSNGGWTDGKGMLMSPFMRADHFDRQMASPYIIEGSRRVEQQDWAGALDVFESGLALYPEVVMLHLGRARALLGQGERAEAFMYIQTAATDPRRSESFRDEMSVLLRRLRLEDPPA